MVLLALEDCGVYIWYAGHPCTIFENIVISKVKNAYVCILIYMLADDMNRVDMTKCLPFINKKVQLNNFFRLQFNSILTTKASIKFWMYINLQF